MWEGSYSTLPLKGVCNFSIFTLSTQGKIFQQTVHANCWRQFAWTVKSCFSRKNKKKIFRYVAENRIWHPASGKNKKNVINLLSAELAQRVEKINGSPSVYVVAMTTRLCPSTHGHSWHALQSKRLLIWYPFRFQCQIIWLWAIGALNLLKGAFCYLDRPAFYLWQKGRVTHNFTAKSYRTHFPPFFFDFYWPRGSTFSSDFDSLVMLASIMPKKFCYCSFCNWWYGFLKWRK